jgi:DNA polymerase-3 subunit delta
LIIQASKNHGFGYKQTFNLDGVAHLPWQNMYSEINSMSLFDGRCLAIANLPNGKAGKFGGEMLGKILQEKSAIVLILPKVDKATQQTNWFSQLKQHSSFIEIPTIDSKAMPTWISNTCKELGIGINSNEIIYWLSQQFEGNLISAYQELQKLALIYPQPQQPSLTQVQQVVLNVSQYSVNELIEACWRGNLELCMKIIDYLKDQSIILCLWLFIEDINLMLKIKQQSEQGKRVSELFKTYRVWGNREQALGNALKRLNTEKLHILLKTCYEIEKQAKGVEPHSDNLWQSMQWLVIKCVKN